MTLIFEHWLLLSSAFVFILVFAITTFTAPCKKQADFFLQFSCYHAFIRIEEAMKLGFARGRKKKREREEEEE